MAIETFDDFNDSYQSGNESEVKPFQFREDKTEEGTLKWLNSNFDDLERKSQKRIQSYQRWSMMYKGIQWRQRNNEESRQGQESSNKKPRMVNNFIYEFISSRVSQCAKFGTNFTCIPWNGEGNDINNAESCDKLLRSRADVIDFDRIQRNADKIKYKYGNVALYVGWDETEGPVLPAKAELDKLKGKNVPEDVQKRIKEIEKKMLKGVNINIGDVCVREVAPDRLFPERDKETWKKVNNIDEVEWENIDKVKADYSKKAKDIKENSRNYYNYSTHEVSRPRDMIMVRYFWHKPTKYLPEGAFITYTDDVILEWIDFPYNHGKLPYVFDDDMDVERELWARPAISQIEQMQRHYNNIDSANARDLGVGSAPKWMVPKGAADFRSMNNEFTIVEFSGPVAPQLVKNNPVSGDAIAIQDRYEKRMSKLMKVYDITRGEVPAGITANSALRFLDEQESQILADDEKKRKRRILDTYRQMIQLMAQYYTAEDGRTARTLGKDNEINIEDLKDADFSQVYDVQFQNTSALPDTKTGKIAAITDLNMATQTDPVFNKSDIIQYLDMGLDNMYVDQATVALKAAQAGISDMEKGRPVPEPQMHDDLMVHYTTFWRHIQSYRFKTRVNPELQERFYTHINTIEYLLFEKSKTNQKLMAEIMNLDYFPSFFILPELPPAPIGAPTGEEGVDTSKMESANKNMETARKQEESNQ